MKTDHQYGVGRRLLVAARLGAIIVACAVATGCSTNAPKYNTNFENVGKLRSATLEPVKIGPVTKVAGAKPDVDKLTIRGGTYQSPAGSYTEYFRDALQQEFGDARLLDPNSKVEISGVLVRNVLDGSGMSVGFAEMEVRLQVKRDGRVA